MAKTSRPKELKPWDRRPWPKRGSGSLSKLYAAVGAALSEWERFEDELSRIFAALVSDPMSLPAQRAYNAVRTFEGRAEMLRAASEAYFVLWPNSSLQVSLKGLLRDAICYSQRRNDIAHGVVSYFEALPWPAYPRWGKKPPKSFGFYPSNANFKDREIGGPGGIPTYCLTVAELDYFLQEFRKLRQPAINLAAQLVGHRRIALSSRERSRTQSPSSTNQEPDRNDQQ